MTHFNTAKKVVQKIQDAGHTALFAGGYVRDLLLKHPSDDIDIATDAPIELLQQLFPKTIPVGINFGIIIVVEEDHRFEVATFRKESEYKDGRRPEKIEKATAKEDALRRDFTINGMFFDPLTEKIYDYVGGREDLQNEVIRAIGNPHERFLEDRLRMIRAVRYASRFRFAIDPFTIEAILTHADDLFPAVAMERVYQEFKKMDNFPNFDEALVMLHRLDLLRVIFPTLEGTPLETIEERVRLIPFFPKSAPVIAKLLELFPNATLREALSLSDYLKLSNKDRQFIEELFQWKDPKERDDYDWAQIYALPNCNTCLEILTLSSPLFSKEHLARLQKLKTALTRVQAGRTLVTADHLIQHGISPGKQLGALLTKGERYAINHNIENPETILKYLLSNS